MIDEMIKGRVNLRLMVLALFLTLYTILGLLDGTTLFLVLAIPSFICFNLSLPCKLYFDDESLSKSNALINKNKVFNWDEVSDIYVKKTNQWEGILNIFINFFLFGWISLIIFRGKNRTLTIVHSEYQEFRIKEYSYMEFDKIVEIIQEQVSCK